ncbi:MAG: hypothetical protein GY858_04205 [Candidatus Omnitrophica bacterium]|nr:hypothetical protein [Candidatus Omnitrophota bacterium]
MVDIIYLDFAKAFDTVSHTKLIQKLGSYGLSGRLLAWIKAYLTGQTQRVFINQSESDSLPVTSGVPQGGVLSTILFLLYVNDLPDFVLNSTIKIFADDVKIYLAFSDPCETDLLRDDLALISQWTKEWQLVLAFLKCEILHLGSKNPRTDYFLGLTKLKSQDSLHDLGIQMSSSLKFSEHCSVTAAKAMQRTSLLFCAFSTTKVQPYIWAFKAYMHPILEYGSPIWNPYLTGDISRLERVQHYFTRRLLARSGHEPLPYQDRLLLFELDSLQLRRLKTDLIYYYKILNDLIPLDPNTFLPKELRQELRDMGKSFLFLICGSMSANSALLVEPLTNGTVYLTTLFRLLHLPPFGGDSIFVFLSSLSTKGFRIAVILSSFQNTCFSSKFKQIFIFYYFPFCAVSVNY